MSLLFRKMNAADFPACAETLIAAGEPVFLFDENPTAERLTKMIYEYVEAQGFVVGQVEFWETKNCRATYRKSA